MVCILVLQILIKTKVLQGQNFLTDGGVVSHQERSIRVRLIPQKLLSVHLGHVPKVPGLLFVVMAVVSLHKVVPCCKALVIAGLYLPPLLVFIRPRDLKEIIHEYMNKKQNSLPQEIDMP